MKRLYEKISPPKGLDKLEFVCVIIALVLFFAHFALILLSRFTDLFAGIAVNTSFLAALQTFALLHGQAIRDRHTTLA